MKDYSMYLYFKGENDNPFDQESQNHGHMFWFYECHFENLFNTENNDYWLDGFTDRVNRKFRSVITEIESKGLYSTLKASIFDIWLNDYLFIDKLTSRHKDHYITEAYRQAVDSHAKTIDAVKNRLERRSSIKQLTAVKIKMLKGKNKLYVSDRLNYPGDLLKIIEDDFDVLHKRYIDIINLIDEQIRQCEISVKDQKTGLPNELDNENAKKVLRRGVDAGLFDNEYQCLKHVTIYQKVTFAALASYELGIKHKWKVFQSLWGIDKLAQVRTFEAKEESLNEVKKLFSKEAVESIKFK